MNTIVFVPNLKTNTYVPLVDVEGLPTEASAAAAAQPINLPQLVPSREDSKSRISRYYTTRPFAAGDGVNLPDDRFIQYYYACLSIIGLYIVYRIVN
jgi:hypothetical protein